MERGAELFFLVALIIRGVTGNDVYVRLTIVPGRSGNEDSLTCSAFLSEEISVPPNTAQLQRAKSDDEWVTVYSRWRTQDGSADREEGTFDGGPFPFWRSSGAWKDRRVGNKNALVSEFRVGPVPAGQYRCRFSASDSRSSWNATSEPRSIFAAAQLELGCVGSSAVIRWRLMSPYWEKYDVIWYYRSPNASNVVTVFPFRDPSRPWWIEYSDKRTAGRVTLWSEPRGWRQIAVADLPGSYYVICEMKDAMGFGGWSYGTSIASSRYRSGENRCERYVRQITDHCSGGFLGLVYGVVLTALAAWCRRENRQNRERVKTSSGEPQVP